MALGSAARQEDKAFRHSLFGRDGAPTWRPYSRPRVFESHALRKAESVGFEQTTHIEIAHAS